MQVGDVAYNSFNETVEIMLKGDWMVGVVGMITPLLNDPDFKVLIYSGQIDIILGAPLTEQFLDNLEWDGDELYSASQKEIWKIDDIRAKEDPIAGYVNYVEKHQFTYAVVRGAGHMVPADQPQRAFDMIERFVENNHQY